VLRRRTNASCTAVRKPAEGELPLSDEVAAERLPSCFQIAEFRQPIWLERPFTGDALSGKSTLSARRCWRWKATKVAGHAPAMSLTPQRAVIRQHFNPRSFKADALVFESTYGGKLHGLTRATKKRF
jgi:hypothetical protein